MGKYINRSLIYGGVDYIERWLQKEYKKIEELSKNPLNPSISYYLYGRIFFLDSKIMSSKEEIVLNYYLEQAEKYWLDIQNFPMSQTYPAIVLKRFGRQKTAKEIMASL